MQKQNKSSLKFISFILILEYCQSNTPYVSLDLKSNSPFYHEHIHVQYKLEGESSCIWEVF